MTSTSDTKSTLQGALDVGAARRVFRPPLLVRVMPLIGVLCIGAASAAMIALAVVVFPKEWVIGLVLAANAWFLAALAGYCGRDLHGKWGLRVVLDTTAATLDLPAGRSLINRPPEQHLVVPYGDIEAIETRLEAYPSFGLVNMQRAYVLRRKSGDLIFLFEDRALGSSLEMPMCATIASDIAARAGVKVHDLGMVAGGGGVLGVWHTHAQAWNTPSLSRTAQLRLWRHAAVTGMLAMGITIFAVVLRLIVGE